MSLNNNNPLYWKMEDLIAFLDPATDLTEFGRNILPGTASTTPETWAKNAKEYRKAAGLTRAQIEEVVKAATLKACRCDRPEAYIFLYQRMLPLLVSWAHEGLKHRQGRQPGQKDTSLRGGPKKLVQARVPEELLARLPSDLGDTALVIRALELLASQPQASKVRKIPLRRHH